MSTDHYKTLGVSRTATEKEIKAAYRKMAVSEHPDKHDGSAEAVARFQDINKAYETLRDAAKRAEYDAEIDGGSAIPPQGAGTARQASQATNAKQAAGGRQPAGGEFNDIFSSMFGGAGGRRSSIPDVGAVRSGATAKGTPPPPPPGDGRIDVTLEEVFQGAQRVHRIQVEDVCPDCRGTGVSQAGRSGLQVGTMCLNCRGAGRKRRAEEAAVNIPPGIYEGARLRLKGKGAVDGHGQRGDLFLTVHIKKHDLYAMEGNDLTVDATVPYTVLVLGGEAQVQTPAGPRALPIQAGTQSGQKLTLKGQGLPALGSRAGGDLLVRVKAEIPKNVSAEERRLLLELARLRKDPVRS